MELVGRWRDESDKHFYQVIEDAAAGMPLPFRLAVLQQLHQAGDSRNAFRIVHDAAVRKNQLFTSKTDLIRQLEPLYPVDYAWNNEKLRSWEWLATYIGLIRPLNSRQADLMICPQPHLLQDLLHRFAGRTFGTEDEDKKARVPVGAWVRFVEANFFSCTSNDRGELYVGLGRALLAMEAAGQINLEMKSDAPGAMTMSGRSVSHIGFELAD